MIERLLFCVSLWELLPSDEQRLRMNELVELDGRIDVRRGQKLKEIIEKKPDATRFAIAEELAHRGALDRPWARALGIVLKSK